MAERIPRPAEKRPRASSSGEKKTVSHGEKKTASAGKAPSKPLSPEEVARREAKRRENARIAREKAEEAAEAARLARNKRAKRRKKLFLAAAIVSLVFVLLYWAWVWLDIAIRPDGTKDALPVLLFTENSLKEDARFEVKETFFDGASYLPVSCLEGYVSVSEFGDHKTRSFMIRDTEEYATFHLGTTAAVINGERVSLKHPAFVKDNVLYLPLDFYATFFSCFKLEISAPLGANVLTFYPEKKPSFSFASQEDQSVLSPDSLPQIPEPETETKEEPQA